MKLSLLQTILQRDGEVKFSLPDKKLVPCHCHVTEVAKINKEFYDCGGNKRKKQYITIQLWIGDDHEHRLTNEKLYHILDNIDESDKNHLSFVDSEYDNRDFSFWKWGIPRGGTPAIEFNGEFLSFFHSSLLLYNI